MLSTLRLWWSLLWRFTLLFLALSYVLGWVVQASFDAYADDAIAFIKWRPTIFWWAIAAILWILSATSTRFLTSIIWAGRLNLSNTQWLATWRASALFCFLLGGFNLFVAYVASTDTWVNFKLFGLYPLFMLFLVFLAAKLERLRRAA